VLSISRSRYTRPGQLFFLLCNGFGIILASIYNAKTPDLYPNNAHRKLGWFVTWCLVAQVTLGLFSRPGNRKVNNKSFTPISEMALEDYHRVLSRRDSYHFSDDSGHGTETNTESRTSSFSQDIRLLPRPQHLEGEGGEEEEEKRGWAKRWGPSWLWSKKLIRSIHSTLFRQFLVFAYNFVDRLILIFGFAVICTGWVTYGGIFKGDQVFSGLAHFIKGGVFFWFGILTLGRWAGCFAEFGWAWNIKPQKSKIPTAEFMESFLLFFYGTSNVFLEHLAAWGAEWSAQDLEHISLTIVFFGGGLVSPFWLLRVICTKSQAVWNACRVKLVAKDFEYQTKGSNSTIERSYQPRNSRAVK